jgi:hypothetical protein
VLLVTTVALACCSASLAAPSGTTKISPQFIVKTDKQCATINASFNHVLGNFPFSHFDPTKPDLKTLPLVGKHFAKALAIRHAIPGELRGLGEPAAGKQAWASIRSLALQANASAIKQVSDALASDAKGFVATVNENSRVHDAIVAKAVAAGFSKTSVCGQVF